MFLFQNQPSSFHSTVPVPPSVLQNFTSLLTTYSIFLSNDLKDIEQVYHAPLNNRLIQTLHGKIDFYKAIFEHKRYICLIIVPVGLRRNIFAHYHPGTSGTHVGEYKALFQIRSRFFWSHLRKLIKEQVEAYTHCDACNIWCTRQSELYFSWPVTSPFYIIHCDLWQPGLLTDPKKGMIHALNCICDLTQFIVSNLVHISNAAVLVEVFIREDVLFLYGCRDYCGCGQYVSWRI